MKRLSLILALIGGGIVGGGLILAVKNSKIDELDALLAAQKKQIESQEEDLSRLTGQQGVNLTENQALLKRAEEAEVLAQTQKKELTRLIEQHEAGLATNRDLLQQVEEMKVQAEAQKNELSLLAAEKEARIKDLEGLIESQKGN